MGNRLFFVAPDQSVQEMNEVKIKDMLESKLQEIVEKNPDLLSRAWDDQPRKLFLISREQDVSVDEDSGNSFSLDHLLVDSKGIPILVEVKRSIDTRSRREVAAQMLDYACRASSWDKDILIESFKKITPEVLTQSNCSMMRNSGTAYLPISRRSIFALSLSRIVFRRRCVS